MSNDREKMQANWISPIICFTISRIGGGDESAGARHKSITNLGCVAPTPFPVPSPSFSLSLTFSIGFVCNVCLARQRVFILRSPSELETNNVDENVDLVVYVSHSASAEEKERPSFLDLKLLLLFTNVHTRKKANYLLVYQSRI